MSSRRPDHGENGEEVDVVIVGAGLAGLTAARKLERGGASVAVLEARDRVGGRTLNHEIGDGQIVELGGEYVGPTQDRILTLAGELGVATYLVHTEGEDLYIEGGKVFEYKPTEKEPLPAQVEDLLPIIGQLEEMSAAIEHPAEPWLAGEAQLWDGQTVETWLRENFAAKCPRAIEFVELFFNSAFGSRARDISLLFLLGQIAGYGDEGNRGELRRAISTQNAAQERRLAGGSQLVSLRLAEKVGQVQLNSPVRGIEQSGATVVVAADTGRWTAKHAIVAVPPQLALEIEWSPLLPAAHDMLRRRMALGTLAKVQAVYSEPFWRKQQLSGCALKLTGTVRSTFDNSPPEGAMGVIDGFVGGSSWREWQGRESEERKSAVLTDLIEAFGRAAEEPVEYIETDWTQERWTRGGPVSALAPGVTTDFLPVLTTPFGLVHWAGSETSDYWNGFMDGAVRSGERAAGEVLDRL